MKWLTVDGISRQIMAPENDNPGGGGAEKTQAEKDLDAAREENTRLANKNKELLTEVTGVKQKLQAWDGLDPAAIRNMLNQFSQDEDLKLISEGKHDEVIKKKTERIASEYQAKINTTTEELTSTKAERDEYKKQVHSLLVDGKAVTSFLQAGGLETAVEDIQLRASRVFTVEKGEAIARDAKGEIILGKSGPMTMAEWAESLRETAPHLFPASAGAEAKGNRKGSGNTIDDKIEAAGKAGDVDELRRLRAEKRKLASAK